MTLGVDTDFIVALEITEHPFHGKADLLLQRLLREGRTLALAPQTLAEFIHVVTDPRRMPRPLSMDEAVQRAERWWQAIEVVRVFPDGEAVSDFLSSLRRHQLGRKRLLDTLLASCLLRAGVRSLITNNTRDFAIFPQIEVVPYA